MVQLRRDEELSISNRKLTITLSSGGSPVIPTELHFAIFEINSPEKILVPIRIFPIVIDKEPVDIFDVDKIGDGNYVATFQMPHTASTGRSKIVWYYKTFAAQLAFDEFTEEFETIDYIEVYGSDGPPIVSINDVRTFLRDKPERHVLVDGELFSDSDVMTAAEYTVNRFNIIPPPIATYTLETFPSDYCLLLGICGWLFDSEANSQLMEQLSYQDGNIHHGLKDKTQLYRQAATHFKNEFNLLAENIKMQINVNGVYSGEGRGVRFLQASSRLRY
ncbi:MAG: hypothetical protein ACTSPI_00165 [Candidatus Heimdallarchaeaceae archaeon]